MTLANTTSFFKVILKEKGEGALSFPYYSTVYIECPDSECPAQQEDIGGNEEPDDRARVSDETSKIKLFNATEVNPLGRASVKFEKPVDFNLLEEDWMEIFTSYL